MGFEKTVWTRNLSKTYELASPKNNNQLIITHWKSNTNILENNHDSFQLSQCKGCELNNLINNPNRIGCLYSKPQKECIVIPAKKCNSSGSNIITITFPRCEIIKALEYNIDRLNNNNFIIPICPTIYIEDNRLTWIKNIINEPISLQLFNIHMINNCINQLEFWTDGSLKNPSSPDIKLGYGWIQVDKNKKITNSFSGALSQWPSSTRAEIFSLLTAILTCPANSIINIYLDSQATIDGFNNWKQKSKTIRSYLKVNNFSLWETIYSTMEKYNLIVNLTKVKAHSNKYPLNDTADSLAKLGSSNNQITKININNITKKYVTLYWKEFLIDYHCRNFIKQICKAKRLNSWTSLNRFQPFFTEEEIQKIEWRCTWLSLRTSFSSSTSFKDSRWKAFKIKLLHNELPVLEILKKRRFDLYGNFTNCPRCNLAPEDYDHLWYCKNSKDAVKTINKKIIEFIKSLLDNNHNHNNNNINHIDRQTIMCEIVPYFNNPTSCILFMKNFTRGLISRSIIHSFTHITNSKSKGRKAALDLLNIVQEAFFEKIWKPRCEEIIEWEHSIGITVKKKKNYTEKCSQATSSNSQNAIHSDKWEEWCQNFIIFGAKWENFCL